MLGKEVFLPWKSYFPSKESSLPSARRGAFVRREIPFLSNEKVSPSEGKVFSFHRAKNFLPQENLFPCGRKNIFLRKEIWVSSERKFCALRKAKNFLPQGKKFPHMRKYFFLYAEINFLIYGNFPPYIRRFFALPKRGRSEARGRGIFPLERDEKEGAP